MQALIFLSRNPMCSQGAISELITTASHWFEINKFSLNESKTKETNFRLSNDAPKFHYVKVLGFTLDSSWSGMPVLMNLHETEEGSIGAWKVG